jgi:hypothetical protein
LADGTAGNFRLRQSGGAGRSLRNLRAIAISVGTAIQDIEKYDIYTQIDYDLNLCKDCKV